MGVGCQGHAPAALSPGMNQLNVKLNISFTGLNRPLGIQNLKILLENQHLKVV
jgi:hypothetical protein